MGLCDLFDRDSTTLEDLQVELESQSFTHSIIRTSHRVEGPSFRGSPRHVRPGTDSLKLHRSSSFSGNWNSGGRNTGPRSWTSPTITSGRQLTVLEKCVY